MGYDYTKEKASRYLDVTSEFYPQLREWFRHYFWKWATRKPLTATEEAL